MDMQGETTGELRLSGALTIRRVAELRDTLMASLASNQDIILDLDADADADISFVQLVLAAEVSARTNGKRLRLKNASAGPLLDVLERGGFLAADKTGLWTQGRLPQ
jgi:anti-anti-sigma regulatory factor